MSTLKTNKNSLTGFSKKIFLLIALLYLLILIKTSWVSDDAFLTFRSVDNFINGYGLRWNILERVQIYTHPLWMFLLSGVYYFIRNPLITFYISSITISLITLSIFALKFAKNTEELIAGSTILFFSKAFIDYSTSGLENPLTHLLVILFLASFLYSDEFLLKQIFTLFFIASLSAFNRMDTVLIFLPSLLYILFKKRTFKALFYAVAGFLPFIIWELFSLIYYGFPFPNTAYAKLATGIDKALLFKQGFFYLQDSLLRDPVTLIVILGGILIAFSDRKNKDTLVATGALLYLIYIIQIGGDFMSGRFFSTLLLIGTVLFIRSHFFNQYPQKTRGYFYLALFILGIYTVSPFSFLTKENGVADEKSVYFSATNLLEPELINTNFLMPNYYWADNGLRHNLIGKKKTIRPSSGMYAFYAGPEVHVVDLHGLGDPLLSRLPPTEQEEFRIGHFFRSPPAGYWEYDRSFGFALEDEGLRKYYEKLSVLIHDENLFSPQRLIMIWRMNTGYYDHLLENYLERIAQQ